MTDNEIIKALECCVKGCNSEGCDDCPLYEEVEDCEIEIPIIALNLINRQKAEIKELRKNGKIYLNVDENFAKECEYEIKKAKPEAVREFAHFLIDKADMTNNIHISCLPDFVAEFISREVEK